MIEFGVLGPLTICRDSAPLTLRAAALRRLLAALLCQPGRPVPVDDLVDAMWESGPPTNPRKAVQLYVLRLRRALGDDQRVRHTTGAYALTVERDELDARRFADLATEARAAHRQGQPHDASRLYGQALALWRGRPYAGVQAGRLVAKEVRRLEEQLLVVQEERFAADLDIGRHAELVAELTDLTYAHPYSEHLFALLMLALFRAGRQAEALEVFRSTRAVLVEQLGVEPGAQLQRLHEAILRADERLSTAPVAEALRVPPAGTAAPPTGHLPAPRQPTPQRQPAPHPAAQRQPAPHPAAQRQPASDNGRRPDPTSGIGRPNGTGRTTGGGQASHAGRTDGTGRGGARPLVAPAQLPPGLAEFAGRVNELRQLDATLLDRPDDRQAAVISAIAGTAGVGKTALAVHWAHHHAERFPDGQLYVNLRGFDPGASTVAPVDAVRGFLDAFGVPPDRIPAGLPAMVGLYRSLVAGRRVLIVLDNARDADQVRPLLPGAPGCVALVTSRNRLSGLVTAEGAHHLTLDLPSAEESRELLARRLGRDRVTAEPQAVDEIIAGCARLPLALAVVAGRAAIHADFPLAVLADQLRDARLDGFTGEDPTTDPRTVFSWSYRTLGPEAAGLFRVLGLHPGPDVSTPAASSLAGVPARRARSLLDELARTHLITEHSPGRYAFHDLLRAYANELANAVDTEEARRAAVRRTLDHYLHSAYAADRMLDPNRDPITLAPPAPGVVPEDFAGDEAALGWYAKEHSVLMAIAAHAGVSGYDAYLCQLAWAVTSFLDRRGHWDELSTLQHAALDAARRLGDRSGEALAHRLLARTDTRLTRFADADAHLRQAIGLYREVGDRVGEAQAEGNVAYNFARQGRHRQALGPSRRAIRLFRSVDHLAGQANMRNAIGWYYAHVGCYQHAVAHCRQALTLLRELGYRQAEAAAWDSLAYAYHRLGQRRKASICYQHALGIFRTLGDRYYEADTLVHLGDAQHGAGHHNTARTIWRRALDILVEINHPDAELVRNKINLDPAREPAPAGSS